MTTTISTTIAAPLPLTTTFTPPSACLSDLWAAISNRSTWMNLGPVNTTQCLPSGWSPSKTFSPGICPSGWIMASNFTTQVSNEPITIGTCCPQYLPSNWVFSTRPAGTSKYSWYTTEICEWSPQTTVSYEYTQITEGATISKSGRMKPGGIWNAYGILVEWQSKDGIYPATATATTTATTSSTPTPTALAQQSADTPSGLSLGAKAGIGVGVALGAILILFALGFYLFRRHKRQGTAEDPSYPTETDDGSKYELFTTGRPELDSTPLHESGGLPKYHRPSSQEPVELEGNHR